jgi:hypothetical protein
VAGTIDYLMFTDFISRPGWLILGEYHRIQKDEAVKIINHPGRKLAFQKQKSILLRPPLLQKEGKAFVSYNCLIFK